MGKASSSKKVARAAGIGGGRVHRRQTPWTYFGVIALIVVLGVVGTVASRDRRIDPGGRPVMGLEPLPPLRARLEGDLLVGIAHRPPPAEATSRRASRKPSAAGPSAPRWAALV